ncbi:MAG: hypothetical protein LUC91_07510 [Prevotella sp.]|nr:hypothetical protein [Prevotella sp.]
MNKPKIQDQWWVTRPKRKLNSVPEELAAFCSVALGKQWSGNRSLHLAFEDELEETGTKRIGERRDGGGSGGRTHAAMLYSLGLWFEFDNKVFLTWAGESIMAGKPIVPILKKQVIHYQFPSAYSDSVHVTSRFKIRPFIFLLRLLSDSRIVHLTQEEIAFVVLIQAENESDRCYEDVVNCIHKYRDSSCGWRVFGDDYLSNHYCTENNLMDISNTIMNWLDFTQLVYREIKVIGIPDEKYAEVQNIIDNPGSFIDNRLAPDVFQRRYGLDPWHQKDTRNLLNTGTISSSLIERHRIIQIFFNYSSLKPIPRITADVVSHIAQIAGTDFKFTEHVLQQTYPHGAIGGYLSNYRNMAFQGTEEAVEFEKATTNLFHDIFGYNAIHLGQTGSKSAPDVLLISDSDGYQAIIDNKAYSKYSISGDHHNRMVYNYIEGIRNYSDCDFPIGFFTYISGGFGKNIDAQIQSEVVDSKTNGSCIAVSNLITLIEDHTQTPYTHKELRAIFGLGRQILLSDIHH